MTTGRDSEPLVSVIIPAFNAQAFIAEAVSSILAQRGAPPFEIIVAPDDGATYAQLRTLASPQVLRILAPDDHHGVAHARNRAMAVSRGTLIALCDADDLWPTNYLQALTPPALTHGMASANTRYVTWNGTVFRTPPLAAPHLTLQACGRCLASIRPVWKKALDVRFQSVFAEDVVHTLHLAALGDSGMPFSTDTHYLLRERHGSMTFAGVARQHEILDAYGPLIDAARRAPAAIGLASLPSACRLVIVESLEFWRFANAAYLATGCAQSFMRFVADRETSLWQQFAAKHR